MLGRLKQSLVTLSGRMIPAAVGLGSVAIYTRLLDPGSVGAYALLLSASLLANGIGFAWLRNATLRVVAGEDDGELRPDVAATIVLAFCATALVLGTLEALTLRILRPGLPLLPLCLAVGAAWASGWYDLNQALMQARLRLVSWGALNLSRALTALVVSVSGIELGLKSDALLIGFIAGNGAAFAFASGWAPGLRGRFDCALFARMARFGWPLGLKAGLEQIAPTVQRYIINSSVGMGAVGVFVVANDFTAQVINSILGSVNLAGVTLAFRARDGGGDLELKHQLEQNARIIFGIAAPLAFGIVVLAKTLASVVFGPKFQHGAETVIVIIGISSFVGYLRVYYFDLAFELAMNTVPQPIISTIGTAVMIGASILFIPHYGANGAALSALAATVAAFVMSAAWGRRIMRLPIPVGCWIKTVFSTSGMVLVLAAFPKHGGIVELIALASLGAVFYAALSLAIRIELVRALLSSTITPP